MVYISIIHKKALFNYDQQSMPLRLKKYLPLRDSFFLSNKLLNIPKKNLKKKIKKGL